MPRTPTPTWNYAVIAVRKGRRLLLVREASHGQQWYLPAGRVEPGESFEGAASRETHEEAGVPIVLEGIHRIEYSPHPEGRARMRVIFVARPADDTPPKQEADEETLEARWIAYEELDALPLRGPDVRGIFNALLRGAPVYPLSILVDERAPYKAP